MFPFETHAATAPSSPRPHEIWARFLGSTLEDRLRYTPSDCFETFLSLKAGRHTPPLKPQAGSTMGSARH